MAFLFLCDATRGAVFAEAFSEHLPDVRFCMDPDAIGDDDIRFIMLRSYYPLQISGMLSRKITCSRGWCNS